MQTSILLLLTVGVSIALGLPQNRPPPSAGDNNNELNQWCNHDACRSACVRLGAWGGFCVGHDCMCYWYERTEQKLEKAEQTFRSKEQPLKLN